MNQEKLEKLIEDWIIPIILLVILFVGISYLLFSSIPTGVQHRADVALAVPENIITEKDIFGSLQIQADAVYVYDVKNGTVIFEKNGNLRRPLASITKLMTVLVAKESISASTIIEISEKNLLPEGDSGFVVGEKWSIESIIDFNLVASSNDAANAIRESFGGEVFIEAMNNKAKNIGMNKTEFMNESGLDLDLSRAGSYGSARDVTLLVEYILKKFPNILESTKYDSMQISSINGRTLDVKNTNKILAEIPNMIGSKTGFTNISGGNLTVVFDAGLGHPVIITVLGSSFDGRFTDVSNLVKATLTHISNENLGDTIEQ